jgi:hypothetical protein
MHISKSTPEVEDEQLDHDCHQMLLEFHLFMGVMRFDPSNCLQASAVWQREEIFDISIAADFTLHICW